LVLLFPPPWRTNLIPASIALVTSVLVPLFKYVLGKTLFFPKMYGENSRLPELAFTVI
jgi:hypothetical protein